ncbi:beta-1,4-glucosyltransferase [Geodermatophilus nigrescens]|uniref:Beta-1,4-glucosyltransferase n=1 Tax=Geodermatophilus nigrescens TaxID=1070870 RepID=A0A1M5D3R8_9ACTN|nr:beta-1,4-glucosyltransferase [Geodermatophilus nigrescens]
MVTWYNHASLSRSMAAGVRVERFTHVGIDGLLLRTLAVPDAPRTSADLLLPILFAHAPRGSRVALIGSTPANVRSAAVEISDMPSRPRVVLVQDGYEGLPEPRDMAARLHEERVDIVVVGLGAPLQDTYVLGLREFGPRSALMLTCGGWIDQVSHPSYYPDFAYRLRINWLIRVMREPRRLWRRYTHEALDALRQRSSLRGFLCGPGRVPVDTMNAACGVTSDGSCASVPSEADAISPPGGEARVDDGAARR